MEIIVIGGSGTIGQVVVKALAKRHNVVVAARQHGDVKVDIEDLHSIEEMYKTVGNCDAVISTTGKVTFAEFMTMQVSDFTVGLNNKLMGQVNLVLIGRHYLNDHGSFTLTSGLLSDDPIRYGSSASMVNAALDGFVRGAAIEMPRGIRVNAVSPTIIAESVSQYGDYFLGYKPIAAADAALGYVKSVEGLQTGQIYKIGW